MTLAVVAMPARAAANDLLWGRPRRRPSASRSLSSPAAIGSRASSKAT
ncbi:MAG: hypothetical protein LW698_04980 [Planctomycetaceae bacterium]|nr:hypothetical protein [Planctomycetaceae bacterium]